MQRRLVAEWLGTFSLLATVVGSGILPANVAAFIVVQLVAAVLATGFFKWLLEE